MGQQVYLSTKEASWIINLLDYHDAPVSNDDKLVLTKIREKANSVAVKANRVRRGPRDYNGLSGFFAPDGVFHECAYQEHKGVPPTKRGKRTLRYTYKRNSHICAKTGCLGSL
ncbi:hypothetical protein Q0V21_31000 [Paenibacillus sp. 11B]|uniref:hypothetical protein n=1 Tax=Paenibacillus sp. 11B TaxID=3060965 RepID=UPI00264A5591|nr:hypothetical protein [Paenibacillus sp. 11B]MDN8593159.1 hypothetical protein [Paenibacillus sp. 11B]